ncbi:MAG: class I SAM-dependent methyltransferase [Chloroflexota bacterium]|nr:class I SAM-dependent methyltransferase [Dehalococcoidia bacterium]MDW8253752.1 class I SAM-dependent methyltransferase [Chloroflexota bacterium]
MSADPYADLVEMYDLEHEGFEDDIDLYEALARRTGGPVLEVGCGTGRVADALARRGFSVIGVDPSPAMLAAARRRSAALPTVRYLAGDAAHLPFAEPVGLAIFALDTFAHLLTVEEQLTALRQVRRLLTRRGRLVIDLAAADPGTWVREESLVLHAWTRSIGSDYVQKLVARTVDEIAQVQTLRLTYDRWSAEQPVRRVGGELRLRYFFRNEVDLLLRLSGFTPEGWYGDYDLSPLESDSPRLIVIARRGRAR